MSAAAIATLRQVDDAAAGDQVDYTRAVYPADAHLPQVRQYCLDRQAQRDPYPSQEAVTSLNIGRGLAPEIWRERRARDAVLHEQTEALAAALERTGMPAHRDADVTAVGLITGAQEPLNSYRSICFLPEVAQRDRRPMLNELRYFRKDRAAHRKYMRMAVVTNGVPVRLGGLPPAMREGETCEQWRKRESEYFELRDRIIDLNARVRRFAQTARETHDVDVVFRGIEFTVKRRNGDDFFSAHPHANLLYTSGHRLGKKEWAAFLACGRHYFGGNWWRDCGKLEDPNEAIKYPFKPAELDPQRIGDAGVRWLFEQTFGLPMTQPMGAFRAWRNQELWVQEKRPDGTVRRRKFRKVVTLEYNSGSRLGLCSVRKRSGKPRDPHKIVRADRPPPENVLLGFTMPQRRSSPYAEPCALVLNYTPSPVTELGQDALATIEAERQKVLPAWHMNGAPDPDVALALGRGQAAALEGEASKVAPFIVHTRSSTADRRTCGNGGRGPPASMAAPADRSGSQSGVDLGIGEVVEPMTRAGLA